MKISKHSIKGSFTLSDGNGNGKIIFFPSCMGCVESNGGVHTGGGSNGNGNGIVMEWVGYPFVTATAMATATYLITLHFAVAVAVAAPPV